MDQGTGLRKEDLEERFWEALLSLPDLCSSFTFPGCHQPVPHSSSTHFPAPCMLKLSTHAPSSTANTPATIRKKKEKKLQSPSLALHQEGDSRKHKNLQGISSASQFFKTVHDVCTAALYSPFRGQPTTSTSLPALEPYWSVYRKDTSSLLQTEFKTAHYASPHKQSTFHSLQGLVLRMHIT